MAHKKDQKAFVVTFPLRTEKWQEDRIDKMMKMLTTFYNDRQRKLVGRYVYLSHSKAYKEAKGKGVMAFKEFMQENGFSQYGLDAFFKADTKGALYKCGLNSYNIQYLSQCAWSAWEKKLFGNGKYVKTDIRVNIFKSRKKKQLLVLHMTLVLIRLQLGQHTQGLIFAQYHLRCQEIVHTNCLHYLKTYEM